MLISEYFAEISDSVNRYYPSGLILSREIKFDQRSDEIGYIEGRVLFLDRSILHFREFVSLETEIVEKISYAYHYQNASSDLIFRYDNASHRPPLSYSCHKHSNEGITMMPPPHLKDVLMEIFTYLNK